MIDIVGCILESRESLIEDIAFELKALSDPNRLKIIALLGDKELCVCNIYEALSLPQNLVSHHLRILKNADLVRARRKGNWIYYRVNLGKVSELTARVIDISALGGTFANR